jgi:hypothetical protein
VYRDRVDAVKEKAAVIEERLRLAQDELTRLEKISEGVTKIGASLGIKEFRDELASSVSTGDIGDNFSGKIAGHDINEVVQQIEKMVTQSRDNIQDYIDRSTNYVDATADMLTRADIPGAYQYTIDSLYAHPGDQLRTEFQTMLSRYAEEGWSFYGLTADYRGTEGCVLVFRRHVDAESFHKLQVLKELNRMIRGLGRD